MPGIENSRWIKQDDNFTSIFHNFHISDNTVVLWVNTLH